MVTAARATDRCMPPPGRAFLSSSFCRVAIGYAAGPTRECQPACLTPSRTCAPTSGCSLFGDCSCGRGLESNPRLTRWRGACRGREHYSPIGDPARRGSGNRAAAGVLSFRLERARFVCSEDCLPSREKVGAGGERERGDGLPAELISPRKFLS